MMTMMNYTTNVDRNDEDIDTTRMMMMAPFSATVK